MSNSETDQETLSDLKLDSNTKLQAEVQTKPMRPIMVVTIRGVAFRAAWGSKRAYILQSLAAEESQVSLPWVLILFMGMVAGAGVTALAYTYL